MLVLLVVLVVISFEMKEKLNSKMSRSSSVGRRKWLKIADAAAAAVAAETESLVCDCQKTESKDTPTDIEQDLRPELLNMSKHTQTGEANRKQRKHSPRIPASRVERRILASEGEDISCSRRTR